MAPGQAATCWVNKLITDDDVAIRTTPIQLHGISPKEYQGEFSRDWILGLSPFYDQTCAQCFTVRQGKWIGLEPQEISEDALKCARWF